jgi:hypothetical protein
MASLDALGNRGEAGILRMASCNVNLYAAAALEAANSFTGGGYTCRIHQG